eukprot:gene8005-10848_t
MLIKLILLAFTIDVTTSLLITNIVIFKSVLVTKPFTNCKASIENIDDRFQLKDSIIEEINSPKLSVKTLDEIQNQQREKKQSETESLNKKQKASPPTSYNKFSNAITNTEAKLSPFGSLTANELQNLKSEKPIRKVQKKDDLNGIDPLTPLSFSIVPVIMSYIGWQMATYFAGHFAIEFVSSDIYPIQRAAIVARNIVVGLFTLASGFSGVIGLGLFLLGLTVGVGVIKGELDPKKVTSAETDSNLNGFKNSILKMMNKNINENDSKI